MSIKEFQIHHDQPVEALGIYENRVAMLFEGGPNPFDPQGSWNRTALLTDADMADALRRAAAEFEGELGGIFGENVHVKGNVHPGLQEFWEIELEKIFDTGNSLSTDPDDRRAQQIARLEDLR